jgi:hypothetical protein
VLGDDLGEVVEAADLQTGDQLALAAAVGVEQRDRAEPARGEPAVVGQCVAQVADPDDDHGPVLGQADLAGDLVAEVLHVVADAPGPVGAEVGEVLAQLGAVDAGSRRELEAGAGRGAGLAHRVEGPQVHRKTGYRRLRDAGAAHGSDTLHRWGSTSL